MPLNGFSFRLPFNFLSRTKTARNSVRLLAEPAEISLKAVKDFHAGLMRTGALGNHGCLKTLSLGRTNLTGKLFESLQTIAEGGELSLSKLGKSDHDLEEAIEAATDGTLADEEELEPQLLTFAQLFKKAAAPDFVSVFAGQTRKKYRSVQFAVLLDERKGEALMLGAGFKEEGVFQMYATGIG